MGIEIENISGYSRPVKVGVVVESPNTADMLAKRLEKGDRVRVVGRLGTFPYGRKTLVFCEHIEMKPKRVQKVEY